MTEETVNLKYRISEVLQEEVDRQMLNHLENFQTSLLKEDELILFLRNDIGDYERLLSGAEPENFRMADKIRNKLVELRRSIYLASQKFENLKIQFNNYLSRHIS